MNLGRTIIINSKICKGHRTKKVYFSINIKLRILKMSTVQI